MNAAGSAIPAGANPFSLRAALGIVLFGAVVFVALLWMIGAGLASGSANDGGNHAAGKGLNGFAALYGFLDGRGYSVQRARADSMLKQEGLLVLTPPHGADASEINRFIQRRRRKGPTLIVLPKWRAMAIPASVRPKDAKQGWVMLAGAGVASWANKVPSLGKLDVQIDKGTAKTARWSGFGLSGTLPEPKAVQTLSSGRILPLVRDGQGQVLAGFLDDGSDHAALAAASDARPARVRGSGLFPVVVVAEPDLIDNYGFARQENALLAQALVRAAMDGEREPVTFDLTLNGHARSSNLLTLAFTPPFLAATLCLLLAAIVIGWRAFLRFGPPRKGERAIAFGKAALVANSSGLVRRSRRFHLLTGPYADRARERIARALALPRQAGKEQTDAAIDRAMESRVPGGTPFSQLVARLRAAHNRHDVVTAARELHSLERKLTR